MSNLLLTPVWDSTSHSTYKGKVSRVGPSSSDRVLQGTLLGPPSPAVGASTSPWDPLSARLSCSRLCDSGKDLKCSYLGGPGGGFGDLLRARVPPAPL